MGSVRNGWMRVGGDSSGLEVDLGADTCKNW